MKNQHESLKKQHSVPQNIMEVEFKLIGDMTVRQFGFVAGGAVICYIIYSQNLPFIIRWPLIILTTGTGLGMAFLPIEERGLDEWARNFFIACYSPTQRIWKKSLQKTPIDREPSEKALKKQAVKKEAVEKEKAKKEKEREGKKEKEKKEIKQLGKNVKENVEKAQQEGLSQKETATKVHEISQDLHRLLKQVKRPPEKIPDMKELREENRILKERLASVGEEYIKLKELEALETTPSDLKQTISFYREQLATMEEKNKALEKELKSKESDLRKRTEGEPEKIKEYEAQIKKLQEENKGLNQKISDLSEAIKTFEGKAAGLTQEGSEYQKELAEKEQEVKQLESERNKAIGEVLRLRKRIQELERRSPAQPPKEKRPVIEEVVSPKGQKQDKKEEVVLEKKESAAPIIGKVPNIINGIIKGTDGNLLPGVMVIIEDEDGDPVRALKTNKLGQFVVSTPLPNGTYTAKVEGRQGFSSVKIVTDGSVLEPIIFKETTRP